MDYILAFVGRDLRYWLEEYYLALVQQVDGLKWNEHSRT